MKIGIIGAGNLGSSLAKLFLKNGYGNNIILSDQNNDLDIMKTGFWTAPAQNNIHLSDIIFITVKPNIVSSILKYITEYGNSDKIIISAAAGVSIDYIEEKLNSKSYPIIRCMPSLAKGAITYYSNKNVKYDHILEIKKMLNGSYILEVKNERLIDVSTILIGSMPAYASFIAREYINFGISEGFTEEEALNLYITTLSGTVDLLKNKLPENIMKMVATPNGVTQKGLDILELSEIKSIISSSLYTSYERIESIKKNLD